MRIEVRPSELGLASLKGCLLRLPMQREPGTQQTLLGPPVILRVLFALSVNAKYCRLKFQIPSRCPNRNQLPNSEYDTATADRFLFSYSTSDQLVGGDNR